MTSPDKMVLDDFPEKRRLLSLVYGPWSGLGWLNVVVLLVICLLTPREAIAHAFGQVNQRTDIVRTTQGIGIRIDIQIGPGLFMFYNPDQNGDGRFSRDEQMALLARIEKSVTANVSVTIAGQTRTLHFIPPGVIRPIQGQLLNGATVILIYSLSLEGIDPGEHEFVIDDNNFRIPGKNDTLEYFVQGNFEAHDMALSKDTWRLKFRFHVAGRDKTASAAVKDIIPDQGMASNAKMQASSLDTFIRQNDLGIGAVLLALGVAFLLGMSHALSPGHGKAMVAAYLIGSKGRIHDAIFLGGVVTFTHVISVICLGIISLFLSKYILPQELFPWIGVTSGILVFLIGYWLLARRALGHALHSHHHHHYDHQENTKELKKSIHSEGTIHGHGENSAESPHFKGLLSLGFAGGMVPCPTALAVLLISVAVNRILFGLLLIVVFSAGLASVLILIGILTVSASRFTKRFSENQKWIQCLPILSGLAIMVIGILITFNAMLAAGILSLDL